MICECCSIRSVTRATDGAPVCTTCFDAGCNYNEVRCELADIEKQVADGAEYHYESDQPYARD